MNLTTLRALLAQRRKAIAAGLSGLLAPLAVAFAVRYGFHVDINTATLWLTAAITAVIGTVTTHQAINAPPTTTEAPAPPPP